MNAIRALVRERTEAVALGAILLVTVLFGVFAVNRPPAPIYFFGLIGGATIALQAIGLVIVYRANRIINFAQIQMGVTAGLVFVQLVIHRTIIRGVAAICPPCLPKPQTLGAFLKLGGAPLLQGLLNDSVFKSAFDSHTSLSDPALLSYLPRGFSPREFSIAVAPNWLIQLNFWASLAIAIALATLLLWALYMLVIRRFTNAPKLVLTVITIAAGFTVQQIATPLLNFLFPRTIVGSASTAARLPFSGHFTWSPVVFSSGDVLTVIVACAVAVGLIILFKRSRMGIVLRGAAENPDRAETLGVNVRATSSRAWLMAGVLSGLAAVLTVAQSGAAPSAGGYDVFVRTLVAAVAGGLVGIPLTLIAALIVGLADQVFAWVFSSQSPLSIMLLVVIVVLLIVQRRRSGRAENQSTSTWHASRELRPIPRELRNAASVRFGIRLLAGIGVVVTLGYPWFMSPTQITIGMVTMIYGILGLSLLVLTGWAGQISLGQMAFAAIGAWVSAVLGLNFLLSVLVGGLAGMMVAVLLGFPSMRLRGLHLAVSTLALGLATSAALFDPHMLGRFLPNHLSHPSFLGINFESDRSFYYLILTCLALFVVATMGLRRSNTARVLIAAKDNEQAAMSFGINLLRARITAFAISGFMAASAGVLLSFAQHGVDPHAYMPQTSIAIFLMALLGGLGSVAGPLLGGVYLGFLQLFTGSAISQITQALLNPGLGVMLLLFFLPGGLAQGVYSLRDAWLRRVASRYHIVVPSLIANRSDELAPIAPKVRPTGGEMFIPKRFRLDGQWRIESRRARLRKLERNRG